MDNQQNINSQQEEQPKAKRTYHKDKSKNKKTHKRLIISLLAVLAVGLLLSVAYYYVVYQGVFYKNSLKNRKILLQAKKSFNEFPGVSQLNPSDKQKLVDSTEADYLAAYVTGFGPNSNETEGAKYLLGTNPGQESISGYIKGIIKNKQETALGIGYYQGYILYFWFGNTIVNLAEGEIVENYGNPKVLEEDRKFAKEQADQIAKDIKDGKITPKAATEKLATDKRLKLNDETNGSIFFETNNSDFQSTDDDGRAESVINLLKKQNQPGLSEVGTIVADAGFPRSGNKKEVGYFMIYTEVVLKGQSSIDLYNSQLNLARSRLK